MTTVIIIIIIILFSWSNTFCLPLLFFLITSNYVKDSVNEATSGASKEANKQVAKDSNASVGTRAEAAKDAVGDKVDESKNNASAEVNKEKAKN